MTKLQAYYMRAAAVHQNIHINYYLIEDGLECADLLTDSSLHNSEDVTIELLADIRDCPQHKKYLAQQGEVLDL